MSIYDYLEDFGGLPVADLRPPDSEEASAVPGKQPEQALRDAPTPPYGIAPGEHPADAVAWRLRHRHWADDPEITDLYEYFLANVDTTRVTALIVGAWTIDMSEENPLIERLIRDAGRFPALRHLFLGDVVQEESEVSWIGVGPCTGILEAFPFLEELVIRGGENTLEDPSFDGAPALTAVRHEHLRRLRFESGGLSARIVRAVGTSDLPALEELELWLGVSDYGGDAGIDDLADLLSGTRVPRLRHLGLMNSEIQDEIAAAIANAPVTARLESLDLSMGTLGDEGAEALLQGQPLGRLRKLTIRHHFLSDPVAERLRTTLRASGVAVEISRPEQLPDWRDDDDRYVEVAE
ncbi:STM4015 family protein [Embleya scabrispora]|uniref:STM4015 family protein n=1 Tax=Embleya scabrispora TaxID=159449 RepID=UPI0003754F76|nr:STM4015 family protein [Embleya scabrispora]MYS84887.1 leucine-rich repeat domain-containing protein [Streptomyces sp. SID5474]